MLCQKKDRVTDRETNSVTQGDRGTEETEDQGETGEQGETGKQGIGA